MARVHLVYVLLVYRSAAAPAAGKSEFAQMQEWWCGQSGHEADAACVSLRMRDASPEERKALRESLKASFVNVAAHMRNTPDPDPEAAPPAG